MNSTYVNYKILVVDNGSNDGSVGYLKKLFKGKIDLIINSNNYGFSKGNNIGIKYALEHGSEYLFLINNDTILHEKCIDSSIFLLGEFTPFIIIQGVQHSKAFNSMSVFAAPLPRPKSEFSPV